MTRQPFHRSFRFARRIMLAALALPSLLTLPTTAQPRTLRSSTGDAYIMDAWGVAEGLPQGTVSAIEQSPDGYLWLGTNGGLVRFDGVTFRTFEQLDPTEMRSSRVRSMAIRGDASVWVGTEDGEVFVLRDERPTRLHQPRPGDEQPVDHMIRDRYGLLWVALPGVGLSHSGLTESGEDTLLPSSIQPAFRPPRVTALHMEVSGVLWVGGPGAVAMLQGAGMQTIPLPALPKGAEVRSIVSNAAGRLWVATTEPNVYAFAPGSGTLLTIQPIGPRYAFDEVLSTDRPYLRAAVETGLLRLWEGAFVSPQSPEYANADPVHDVYIDGEENIWLGTSRSGLVRIRRAPFEVIRGSSGRSITSMIETPAGDVLVGLNCGGVEQLIGSRLVPYAALAAHRPECVWSLHMDRSGRLWVGTWGGGVFRTSPGDPSQAAVRFDARSFIGSDVVLAMAEDSVGGLWFGTGDAGLVRLNRGKVDRWTVEQGLPSNDVRAIAFDGQQRVWVGTTKGLVVIEGSLVRVFTTEDGLTSNAIRTIKIDDADGSVWIGTYGGGLIRYKNGTFRPITIREGLYDNVVSQFLIGVQGFAWIGSNRGIWRVPKQELDAVADGRLSSATSIAYGKADGLSVIETNGGFQPCGLRLSNGDLLFPTIEGVARVQTAKLRLNRTPPPVRIERVVADGRDLPLTETIEVRPDIEGIRVVFTALSFAAPEKVQFRYQLIGYNKSWIDLRGERSVTFTKIPPGTYRFRVIAANNDGLWNEEGEDVTLVIEVPFWQTMWFRGLVVLALIGMGMLVVTVRLRQVRRQKELQEETSRRLIESQEEERQRIAGELHDSLGQELIVAKNRVMLAAHHLKEDATARGELTQVADALTNALRSVRNIAYNLRPFQLDRLGLTETIRSTVRTIQQATPVVFETEIHPIDGLLSHEAEIGLFRIVQEALTNVVKHAEATRATVVVSVDENAVVMRIEDNGKGFGTGTAFDGAPRYGFGLSGIVERVRLLRGVHRISSVPGEGTTVAVRIPVDRRPGEADG